MLEIDTLPRLILHWKRLTIKATAYIVYNKGASAGALTIRLYRELPLENPVLIAGGPGIGDIWTISVNTMRETPGAEEFGELEPHHFFYLKRALIRKGMLEYL